MRLTSARLFVLTSILVAAPSVARAQDPATFGLTMGYPSSVGVIWQMSDRVALRPEITLSRATGDSSTNDLLGAAPVSTNDSTGIGAGISALFYVRRWEGLRTYLSPRLSYQRLSASASTSGNTSTSDSTTSAYFVSGSFGAQYALGRHFGLFGEVGLGYTSTSTALSSTLTVNGSTRPQLVQSSSTSNAVATRSGAGVIFYF